MNNRDSNNSIFEKSTEIVGAFQIFLSPFLFGVIIAAIVYFPNPNNTRLIIAILIIVLGIIIGIKLVSKIYRSKKGTIDFISKTDSTPDIDNLLNKKEK